jgi:hypothetical protein
MKGKQKSKNNKQRNKIDDSVTCLALDSSFYQTSIEEK